jgi:predicted GNAT family N-acyltransferase
MALDTRLTRDPAELDAICRFRFQVYYHELGARLPEEVIRSGQLRCNFDEVAYQYASFEDGEVVGCVRVVDLADIQKDEALIAKYRLHDVINKWGRDVITFTGRMAVAEKFRKSSLVHRLMVLATHDARERGIRTAFLDCSPHLLPFYEAFGFRRYAPAFSDPVFGFKQPLLFMLRDQIGLKAIGSPLARTLNHYDDDPEIRQWYGDHYSAFAANQTATVLPCGTFTDLVENLFGKELTDVPLFRNLSRQEIDLVLKKSTVVRAQPGDVVIRSGLHEPFICVVLTGCLETTHAGHRLDFLVCGDVCGETEFLAGRRRMVEMVSRATTDLLVLPTEHLIQLIEKDVVIGRTLMKNLAIAMATRSAARLDGMAVSLCQLQAGGSSKAVVSSRYQMND